MIKKSKDSNIFDQFVIDMLTKEGAGIKPIPLEELVEEIGKTAPEVIEEVAPGAAKAAPPAPPAKPEAPPKVEPPKPKAPPAKPPAAAAKAALEETLRVAKGFENKINHLIHAMQEFAETGAVVTRTNYFFGESSEELLRQSNKILSSDYEPYLKTLQDAAKANPGSRKVQHAINKLKSARLSLLEEANSFRNYLETAAAATKAVPEAEKVVEEAVETADDLSDVFSKAIADLEKVVGDISAKNEELYERLIKQAASLGYWKGVAKTLRKYGTAGVEQAEKVEKVIEKTSNDVSRLTERVVAETPNPAKAKPIVEEATQEAIERGAREGSEGLDEAIQETPEAAEAAAKGVDEAAEGAADPKQVSEFRKTLEKVLGKYIGENAPGWAVKAVGIGAVILLVGSGGLYWYFNSDSGKRLATQLEAALNKALVEMGKLRFVADSEGLRDTGDLMTDYREGLVNIPKLSQSLSEQELEELSLVYGEVHTGSLEYIDDEPQIAQDLVDSSNWDNALDAVRNVYELTITVGDNILSAIETERARATREGVRPGEEGRITGPVGREAEGVSPGQMEAAEPSSTFEVPGTNIVLNFENAPLKSAGFRSAVPRMMRKIFTKPAGLAFIDPEGAVWTGVLSRSTRQPTEKDYWRALGYLYQKGIYTAPQLRRHMRDVLSRQERRRHSAWREALKYYRGSVSSKYAFNFSYENIEKTANLLLLDESSINKRSSFMRKFADEFSNTYVQDAIKDLSDEYAKSYFSGLKSMYDERLGSSDADFAELYRPAGGTGAETIGEAHPDSLTIAESMGRGGLVENLIEQQRASIDVALSTPSGNFRGKHADLDLISALVKMANDADAEGNTEISDIIDEVISELTN